MEQAPTAMSRTKRAREAIRNLFKRRPAPASVPQEKPAEVELWQLQAGSVGLLGGGANRWQTLAVATLYLASNKLPANIGEIAAQLHELPDEANDVLTDMLDDPEFRPTFRQFVAALKSIWPDDSDEFRQGEELPVGPGDFGAGQATVVNAGDVDASVATSSSRSRVIRRTVELASTISQKVVATFSKTEEEKEREAKHKARIKELQEYSRNRVQESRSL